MKNNLYNKFFYSTYNLSFIKTIAWNLFNNKSLKPKLYLGKGTSILNKNGSVIIDNNAFIDCKNAGQFFYDSHLVIEKNAMLKLGHEVNFYSGAQVKCFEGANINIGKGTYFSGPVTIHSKKKITIGQRCSISWGVTIIDSDFHSIGGEPIISDEVVIENDVWIGCNATILKGVHIPQGSVIAANSVVTNKITKAGVYAGNPARLIKGIHEKN